MKVIHVFHASKPKPYFREIRRSSRYSHRQIRGAVWGGGGGPNSVFNKKMVLIQSINQNLFTTISGTSHNYIYILTQSNKSMIQIQYNTEMLSGVA